jgi:hypothetical protein
MFRQLARWFQEDLGGGATPEQREQAALRVLELHPVQLARFLEEAWFARADPAAYPSKALPGSIINTLRSGVEPSDAVTSDIYPLAFPTPGGGLPAVWHHLIYAYMIENTRVIEIFRRVLWELLHGENLEVPSVASHHWLRNTEDLFFRDAPSGQLAALTSWIRPDLQVSRCNAYVRVLGMALSHGTPDGRPYQCHQPRAANLAFVSTFEEFLREIWLGIENSANTSGANATDDAAIANLAQQLFDMLTVRQRLGNLRREGYFHVDTMEWMHLTVEVDSPIVVDLKAQATSPEERLRKIGERVGIGAHSRSQNYFRMAEPLSRILLGIESGVYNDPANVRVLYAPPEEDTPNPIREDILTIITNWSIATGRDIKAGRVSTVPSRRRVVVSAPPAPAESPAPTGNGRVAAGDMPVATS